MAVFPFLIFLLTGETHGLPQVFRPIELFNWTYINDKLSNVFGMRYTGSYWVLRLWDDWPLVYSPHSPWLAHDVLESLGLLQLAQVIVLQHG